MSRPKVETVKRALLSTPLEVRSSVWHKKPRSLNGKKISVRTHYFGFYDEDEDLIVLGRMHNKTWGQTDELVDTHIHEALHKVRPDWPEEVVRMEEARYARSRALREASLVKILNVTLFGRDLDVVTRKTGTERHADGHYGGIGDAVRVGSAEEIHVGEAPQDSASVGEQVR